MRDRESHLAAGDARTIRFPIGNQQLSLIIKLFIYAYSPSPSAL